MKKLVGILFAVALLGSLVGADETPPSRYPPYYIYSYTPNMSKEFLAQLVRQKQWVEPIFGPEFTMGGLLEHNGVYDMNRRCRKHLIDGQCDSQKFLEVGSTFMSPNGWDFTVEEDPGVIEVKMSPMTVEDFDKYKVDIQDAIFASASNIDMFPEPFLGGGHISIGYQAFANNSLLLRNFIVDLYNHSELALGVFNYDTNNALPLPMLREKAQDDLFWIIERFDQGRYNGAGAFRVALANASLQYGNDPFVTLWKEGNKEVRGKHTAVNFNRLGKKEVAERRIEIRSVRAQTSVDVFVRQIRLLRDRLKYLDSLNAPLPIKMDLRLEQQNPAQHQLNPPVNAQGALRAFYQYVKESGHKWRDHTDYLWPQWIQSGELRRFESSDWFRQQEVGASCPSLLKAGAK